MYLSLEILYQTVLNQVTSFCQIPDSQVVNLRVHFHRDHFWFLQLPLQWIQQFRTMTQKIWLHHLNSRKIIILLNLLWKRGRKENQVDKFQWKNIREIRKTLNDKIHGETHFCLSLVDILNKLSPGKNLLTSL